MTIARLAQTAVLCLFVACVGAASEDALNSTSQAEHDSEGGPGPSSGAKPGPTVPPTAPHLSAPVAPAEAAQTSENSVPDELSFDNLPIAPEGSDLSQSPTGVTPLAVPTPGGSWSVSCFSPARGSIEFCATCFRKNGTTLRTCRGGCKPWCMWNNDGALTCGNC